MKVSELIEKLKEFPQDSEIVVEYPESGGQSWQDYTIEGDIAGFDIRIGTLMTEMEYECGGDVSDGTAGTVCVNISFAKRGRKGWGVK